MKIEAKFWKDGYIQTGIGSQVSIILRDDDNKMLERVVFSADMLEDLKKQLEFPPKAKPEEKGQATLI